MNESLKNKILAVAYDSKDIAAGIYELLTKELGGRKIIQTLADSSHMPDQVRSALNIVLTRKDL